MSWTTEQEERLQELISIVVDNMSFCNGQEILKLYEAKTKELEKSNAELKTKYEWVKQQSNAYYDLCRTLQQSLAVHYSAMTLMLNKWIELHPLQFKVDIRATVDEYIRLAKESHKEEL